MTVQVIDVLKAAREKIAQGWTQETCARDADGRIRGPSEPAASCWCAYGAVVAAVRVLDPDDSLQLDIRTVQELEVGLPPQPGVCDRGGKMPIAYWNDAPGRTQAEVLELFDLTIERLNRDTN